MPASTNSAAVPPAAITQYTLTHFTQIILQKLQFVIIKIQQQQTDQSRMNKNKPIKKQAIKNGKKNGGQTKQQSNHTSDKRFRMASYDPKFTIPSQTISKIKIDKRFADKMNSQKFQTGGGVVDKYGRKIDKSKRNNEINQYYYTQQNLLKNKEEQQQNLSQSGHRQNDDDDMTPEQNQKLQKNISKWMQDYNQQSSQGQNQFQQQNMQDLQGVWSGDDQNVIKGQSVQVTCRLALCNYDWMNINAKDLMLLFSSFKPSAGVIKSISVYYSNIGKQKLQMEEIHGPQGIWNQIPEDQHKNQQKNKKKNKYKLQKMKNEQEAFNQNKLRAYEKQRLKYFYAVIECNSKKTAQEIYKQCDGNQFQNSNLLFDLRFIPDIIEFDESMLKQRCDQLPASGQVKNFINRALGHSKVNLTWQDPQLNEIANLKKKNWNKISEKQLDNIDWGLYINEQAQQQNDKLNKILKKQQKHNQVKQQKQVKQNSNWRAEYNKKNRRQNEQETLQITFPSGFETLTKSQQKPSLNKQIKSRKERWQANKNKKNQRQKIQLLIQKDDKKQFKYNPEDQRFKAVFNNPMYSINPVDSKFDHRRIGNAFQQVVKRNRNKHKQ